MTHTDPSADAFMRRILSNPVDAVPRLVFADWLEESGTSSNLAWARYLRLADELANAPPDDERRGKMALELARIGSLIRAKLTCRAEVFIAYPEAMLQLLPAQCISLNVNWVTIPNEVREFIPSSVAQERQVLPLALIGGTFVIGAAAPSRDTCQMLAFIFNREIQTIAVPADQIGFAIERHYPPTEVVETVFRELFTDPPLNVPSTVPIGENYLPIARLVNLILNEAIQLQSSEIELIPRPDRVQVIYLSRGQRIERDSLPLRLLNLLVIHLRALADTDGHIPMAFRGVNYRASLQVSATPDGPHVLIRIHPATTEPPAALNPAA